MPYPQLLPPNALSGCSVPAFQSLVFTTFLKNCGRGESLGTTLCLKTVVGVSKGMLHVKYYRSTKPVLCQLNFMDITTLSQSSRDSGHPQFLGYCWIYSIGVCLAQLAILTLYYPWSIPYHLYSPCIIHGLFLIIHTLPVLSMVYRLSSILYLYYTWSIPYHPYSACIIHGLSLVIHSLPVLYMVYPLSSILCLYYTWSIHYHPYSACIIHRLSLIIHSLPVLYMVYPYSTCIIHDLSLIIHTLPVLSIVYPL